MTHHFGLWGLSCHLNLMVHGAKDAFCAHAEEGMGDRPFSLRPGS